MIQHILLSYHYPLTGHYDITDVAVTVPHSNFIHIKLDVIRYDAPIPIAVDCNRGPSAKDFVARSVSSSASAPKLS